MSKREAFLLWLLAGLLAWQAAIFTMGVLFCGRVTPTENIKSVCPDIGSRFDSFTQTSLGAVLGLIGGAAVVSSTQNRVKKKPEEDPDSYKED